MTLWDRHLNMINALVHFIIQCNLIYSREIDFSAVVVSSIWDASRAKNIGDVEGASCATSGKGERVTREPFERLSVRRQITPLHENCVNVILRIKPPESSFPFDPLSSQTTTSRALPPCPYWPSPRSPLPSRLRPPSPPRSHLLHLDLSSLQQKPIFLQTMLEAPIVQISPYTRLAGEMKYAAKRHMQSVRQVVRQIKRSSHGRIRRRTDEYEVSGSHYVRLRAIISSGNVWGMFQLYHGM